MIKKNHLSFLLGVILVGGSIASVGFADNQLNRLQPDEQNTIDIFEKIAPLVVNIHKINHVVNPQLNYIPVETGSGSGFLWDNQHIVTNYHVVQGANEVIATFKNGQSMRAKIIGSYPRKDIAVLRLDSETLLKNIKIPSHFPIADSSQLHVGQNVIAIGNPFGLDHTLTKGIISALNRQIPTEHGASLSDLIQTDASINPGNSGGPLLNSRGELIGMNTAIFSTSGSSAGIGFAILSNDIQRVVAQIIQHGKVKQSSMGIIIFNDAITRQFIDNGVLVNKVLPNTPAFQAGLHGTERDAFGKISFGDVITKINQQVVKSTTDLLNQLDSIPVGETITITVLRNGKAKDITLKTIALNE